MKLARLARLSLVALFVLLLAPAPAAAHSGIQSYIYVSIFDDGLEGRVEYPIDDLAEVLDIDLPDAQATIDGLSEANRTAIVDYTREHLEMRDDDGLWELDFEGTVDYLAAGTGYVLVPFDVVEEFDDIPRRWTVTYDGVIEAKPERDALFLIEDDWRTATFRNEGQHLLGFSVGNETQVIELDTAPVTESMREVGRRGMVAIDKSAIILAAVIAVFAGAFLSGSARRATSWVSVLREAATSIALMAVGLNVSLWGLGLVGVDVGSRSAMVFGALGVLVAAATWWMTGSGARTAAFAAGTLSGVALGSVFVDQLLDRAAPIRSMLAFGVGAGVMVGVVAVLVAPLLLLIRFSRAASAAGMAMVGIISVAGIVWLIESTSGARFRLRSAELRVADVLTSPIIIGVVTAAVAVAVLASESNRSPELSSNHDESRSDSSESVEVQ